MEMGRRCDGGEVESGDEGAFRASQGCSSDGMVSSPQIWPACWDGLTETGAVRCGGLEDTLLAGSGENAG